MSIKLTDLEASNINSALNSVSKELDFSLSYSIGRVLDGLKGTVKSVDKSRIRLLKEMGILKEDGSRVEFKKADGTPDTETPERLSGEFTKKFIEALESNVQEYGFNLIQKSKLKLYDWTPQFLSTIMPVILEEEETETEPVIKKVE
jgi:hypothetical protein